MRDNKKIAKGFRWAKREHKWENYTNYVIVVGFTTIYMSYHYSIFTAEFALIFITSIAVTHFVARFSHKMEQIYLREMRKGKK